MNRKASESAMNTLGYLILRYLSGKGDYPEEILAEMEMFLRALLVGSIYEAKKFFYYFERELKEGDYAFLDSNLEKRLDLLNCPILLRDIIKSHCVENILRIRINKNCMGI